MADLNGITEKLAAEKINDEAAGDKVDQVTPWMVEASSEKGIDYTRLISMSFEFLITLFPVKLWARNWWWCWK